MTRHGLAACAAWLAASGPGVARASDLSWSGPAECARGEQLVFEVERALGAALAETGQVHLQVHVARAAPTARALLRIADDAAQPPISERRLVAPDCDKLVDTLAVAITLAIEAAAPPPEPAPELARRDAPPAAEPAPPRPPAAVVAPAHAEPALDHSPSESEASSAPSPGVTARLLGDVGSLPAPALGVGFGVQLGWPRWQLEMTGTLWAERHARLDTASAPEVGADVSLATGALAACTLPLDKNSVAMALCAGWEMGRVSGVGTGISSPRRSSGLWLAPGIEAGVTWMPAGSRLGIGLRLGAAAPLGQRSFYLERLGTVHEVASLVARAGLSLDVALD